MIRIAGLWHCVGAGGGDGFTCSIVRYARNLIFTGVVPWNVPRWKMRKDQFDRALYQTGGAVKSWHCVKDDLFSPLPEVEEYPDIVSASLAACQGADIVLTWGFKDLPQVAPHLDIPIVECCQGADTFSQDITKGNLDHSHYKVAVSKTVAKKCWAGENPFIIYNGADPTRVYPRMGRQVTRQSYQLEEKKVVLIIQRTAPMKNPEALVQGLAALPENFVGLVMADGDPYHNGLLRDAIEKYLSAGRVLWIEGGWNHPGDLYAAADCFLLASDSEGWPLAVLEAMLSGTPCVLSSNAAHLEMKSLWKDHQIAEFVPTRPKPQELAEAIQRAVTNPQMAWTAQQIAFHEYSALTTVTRWEQLLEDCLHDWYRRRRTPNVHAFVRPPLDRTA